MSEQPTFEEALQQLEAVVARLEQGQIPLDEALECFEAGVRSATLCRKMLKEVEGRVALLMKQADGSFATEKLPALNADSED